VDFKSVYCQNKERYLKDLFTYLEFQSVSSEAKYKKELKDCAQWLCKKLEAMGLESFVWPTKGHDVVFGQKIIDPSLPTLMIYGHYDVQPVDPIDLWKSDPFKPEVRDSRIYARGAEDNKGQSFYAIMAVEAFLQAYDRPNFNIKVLIEGEEEIGSPSLKECLIEKKEFVQADTIWVVDMGMGSMDEPCMTIGARGLYAFDLTLRALKGDCHSGEFGGIAYNPNRAMAELIAKTFGKDGSIQIKGFYDDVKELGKEQKKMLDLAFDFNEFRDTLGVLAFHREGGLSPAEANFLRPTFEVNGIWGGYIEEGFKTVIPAETHAKISCRLVPNQEPQKIAKLIECYIKDSVPDGIEVSIKPHGEGKAYWTSPDSDAAKLLIQAMKDVSNKECKFIFSGGSIPISYDMAKICGAQVLFPGTALTIDNIHAPNESFGLDQFELGFYLITRALELMHEKS
jgi:acetylornithine deacetylase/succinyl-diaminopimelate desuccinylase-like protein